MGTGACWPCYDPAESLTYSVPQQNLNDMLPLIVNRDVNQLPVVQDGRPVGVLSCDAIMRYLEVRRNLGLEDWRRAA